MKRQLCAAGMTGLTWLLVGCGGGGGGSGSAPPPAPPALVDYPTLVESPDFSLPAIDSPATRPVVQGAQQGRVLVAAGTAAGGGLTVQWLDASNPGATVVLATAVTQADGSFAFAATSSTAVPADQWLQVTLADGSVLRAWATGWAELSPGTEAAVREIARLRQAGAFTAHVLTTDELVQAQESLTLAWLGAPASSTPAAAADAMVQQVRFLAPWNHLLDLFALNSPNVGAGDIAGLVPVGTTQFPSTLTRGTQTSQVTFVSECFGGQGDEKDCSDAGTGLSDLDDGNFIPRTAIGRNLTLSTTPPALIEAQAGELPILEFPYQPGTTVLYSNARFMSGYDPNIRGTIKVTRRVYPAAPLQVMGTTVQAVESVLDFELTALDYPSQIQYDTVWREKRWYSPGNGRVRFESLTLTRSGPPATIATAPITTTPISVVANSVSGDFFAPAVLPFAGMMDVLALGLPHRDAVYSATRNRVYAAVATAGGQILELDPDTLATLRTLPTATVPGKLAVSADGSVLYAGLDGGQLVEYRLSDFAILSSATLPSDPYGLAYDRIYDLSIDPFDSDRVALIGGSSTLLGQSGALLVYRHGALVLRDAPHYYATDYGWGAYSPGAVAWTTVRDDYLLGELGSPKSIYRLHADETAGVTTDVSSLPRVDDIGWHDVGGSVFTDAGRSLDAVTFQAQSSLSFGGYALTACHRQDATADLCELPGAGGPLPSFVRLDHASSAFLGVYRPVVSTTTDGCNAGVLAGTFGTDDATLLPTGSARNVVSSLSNTQSVTCNLEVWKLRGVN